MSILRSKLKLHTAPFFRLNPNYYFFFLFNTFPYFYYYYKIKLLTADFVAHFNINIFISPMIYLKSKFSCKERSI